jgi:hypothetical protein
VVFFLNSIASLSRKDFIAQPEGLLSGFIC